MLLSIIIAAKNWNSALDKTIGSVLEQSLQDYEVIVQIKDSGLYNMEEKYGAKVAFYQAEDTGIYDALNKGIDKAKGDYILFLGQGDYLINDSVIENFKKDSFEANNAYWGEVVYYKNDNEVTRSFVVKDRVLSKKSFTSGNPLHTQGLFIKTEIYREYKYDIDYKILADFEFLLRSNVWKNLTFLAKPIVMFELGGASTHLASAAKARKEAILILSKYNILPSARLVLSYIYYSLLNILPN
jgi:glycosyltransferase involved in cell wall biosynthesis